MLKKFFILFLINIFILGQGVSFSEEPLSLESLIKEAKENSPDILAAKKRWEAAKTRIPQAKSLDNPNIGISFEKIPRGTIKIDKTMPEERMLSVTQMFPWFGKLPLKGKIALVESQMFAAEYKNKELQVINEVKNVYYDLFMNYKEVQLKRQSLVLLEAISAIAESKYSVGEISQEEVFKLHLEIAKLNNNIINLEQEKAAKQTRLNTLLNREPQGLLGTPYLNEEISFDKDIFSLYKPAMQNQPELLIFSYAIEKNQYAKSLAKRSFFPDLMAGLVQRGIASGGIGPWDLMLSFSLPFWFWTKQRYEVKEAVVNSEEAKAAYQAMKNKALSETQELFTPLEKAAEFIRRIPLENVVL